MNRKEILDLVFILAKQVAELQGNSSKWHLKPPCSLVQQSPRPSVSPCAVLLRVGEGAVKLRFSLLSGNRDGTRKHSLTLEKSKFQDVVHVIGNTRNLVLGVKPIRSENVNMLNILRTLPGSRAVLEKALLLEDPFLTPGYR